MKLYEWEIWHTYSTYIESSSVSLDKCAESLVAAGVAEFVILEDGESFWQTPEGVGRGVSRVDLNLVDNSFAFSLELDKKTTCKPQGFALEAFWQAVQFHVGAERVFGPEPSFSPPCLRAFLGKISLSSEPESGDQPHRLDFYPVLLIYETGVMTLELRMIGPNHPTELEEFITGGVNFFRYSFERVEVSPGLSREATRAYYQSAARLPIWIRPIISRSQATHSLAISQQSNEHADTDFTFNMAPLSSTGPQTLRDIAITIFQVAAFLSVRPRDGWRFVLIGQRAAPRLGQYWSGRPHVHLVRFDGQSETAQENEQNNSLEFVSILARVPPSALVPGAFSLPNSLRASDDYGAYVTSASSLWVWSKKGLRRESERADANRGNLIYERQLAIELLEYGYMLHRSLYHRIEALTSSEDVAAVRYQIVDLRRRMRESSHAGEIRDLLNAGWKEMFLPDLRDDIDDALSMREADRRAADSLRATRVGWALTTVFGFVAVPALADQLVMPIWRFSGVGMPASADLQKLWSAAISVVVAVPLVLAATLLFGRRRG